jgi:hypothetical protein
MITLHLTDENSESTSYQEIVSHKDKIYVLANDTDLIIEHTGLDEVTIIVKNKDVDIKTTKHPHNQIVIKSKE